MLDKIPSRADGVSGPKLRYWQISLRGLLIAGMVAAVVIEQRLNSRSAGWQFQSHFDLGGPHHISDDLNPDRKSYFIGGEGDQGKDARCYFLIRGPYQVIKQIAVPLTHWRRDTWKVNGRVFRMPVDKQSIVFAEIGKEGHLIALDPGELGVALPSQPQLTPKDFDALFDRLQQMHRDPNQAGRFVSVGMFIDMPTRF